MGEPPCERKTKLGARLATTSLIESIFLIFALGMALRK